MALVVTGLSQNGDLTALATLLQQAGLPADELAVVGPREALEGNSGSLVGFRPTSDTLGDSTNAASGTGVPGISSSHVLRSYFRSASVDDRLSDLGIMGSEADNYLEALERGRTVVAYRANAASIDLVETAFREAGLLNVRRF